MVVIGLNCARCNEPLQTIRLKDEKWVKKGRSPPEGRPILYCRVCARIPKAKNIVSAFTGQA